MKKILLIVFSLSFLSSCSNDKDFFLTKENALISCGWISRIIESENEEIINTEVKDLIEKSFSTLYEDVKDYEIDYEE